MKLLIGLSVLNKEEWFSFRKYLLMHTSEKSDLFLLFQSLQLQRRKLDKSTILTKIKDKYFFGSSQKNYLNLQSKLYQVLEDWFVFYDVQNDEFKKELQLIISLKKRGLYSNSNVIYEKLLKSIEEGNDLDFHKEHKRFQLHHEMYYSDSSKKKEDLDLLKKTVNNFLSYSQKQLLFYNMELHSWGAIKGIDHSKEIEMVNNFLEINGTLFSEDILILLSKVVIEGDAKAFKSCVDYLYNNQFQATGEFEKIFILYLFSKSGLFWQQGKYDDKTKLLWLCSYSYESGASISNRGIPQARFYNSVSYFLFLGDETAGVEFIEKWVDKVVAKSQDAVRQIALATVDFYCENYQGLILKLISVKRQEIDQMIRVNSLLLLGYYELKSDYGEILIQHIENYKRFLRRHKASINPIYFIANLNLIKIIELLYIKRSDKHSIDINVYQYLMYRAWVIKKLKRNTKRFS